MLKNKKLSLILSFLFLVSSQLAAKRGLAKDNSGSKDKFEVKGKASAHTEPVWKHLSSNLGFSLEYPGSWEASAICAGAENCQASNSDHVTIEAPKSCSITKAPAEGCGAIDVTVEAKGDLSNEQKQDLLTISGFPAYETVTDNMATLEIKTPSHFFLVNWNGPTNASYVRFKKSLSFSDVKSTK